MRGLPLWILGVTALLAVLLIWIGWHDRHHVGYIPFALGIIFGLFAIASFGAKLKDEGLV